MHVDNDTPPRLTSTLLRTGILARSVTVTLAVFVLASVGSIGYTVRSTSKQTQAASNMRLEQLIDTVESTVKIACFLKDHDLAKEVALGLLSNTEILQVGIIAGDEVLADQERSGITPKRVSSPRNVLKRPITSPFKADEIVGEIKISRNPDVIANQLRHDIFLAATQLLWQLTLVSGAIVASMLMFVVRPISTMSRQLHQMDPTSGERVAIPSGHTRTEIGQLAEDVNHLASRLVQALNKEHALRLQREVDEKKYHAIFDNAESGIFIVDGEGVLRSWNPAFARLLGISRWENSDTLRLTDFPWEIPTDIDQFLQRCFQENAPVSGELSIGRHHDQPLWLGIVLSPVGGGLIQGVVHDVSGLKEAEASARRQAITDPLTGLANRAGLEERLRAHIVRHTLTQRGGAVLMMVDIDKFRQLVEGMGLPVGDEILKTVANRLSAIVKRDDTVARLSADIFGLVLPNLDESETVDKVADRVTQALRQPYVVDGSPIRLSASIGITLFPNDGTDVPSLLRHTELAVDKAKAAGGNTSVFFDTTLAEAAEQRHHLENDLRLAIRNHNFELFFQPIVDLQRNRLSGAEALIRWRHPDHGLIGPDRFIPIAEQTGLINDIGLWVVDSACHQLQTWRRAGLDYTLSLNVSGRQIPDGLSPAMLQEALTRHGVTPASLALEITEGVLLNDIDQALHWLNAMRNLGVRIYMDDFGTGYSSLSYLKRFPIDTLKVDKSFIMDMHKNDSDRPLVESIIAMARSLKLKVVAEGVEAVSHVEMLRDMGCHYAQGYYFSRPLPAEDFALVSGRIAMLSATAPVAGD